MMNLATENDLSNALLAGRELPTGMPDVPAGAPAAHAQWLLERCAAPMPAGAVLLHAPTAAFQAPGGGEHQLLCTAWHLEALGVTVRPFVPWIDRLDKARLLHVFGMSAEGLALARVARARSVKVVLSPICWYEPRALAALAPSRKRAIAALAKWTLRRFWPTCPGWRRELLGLADAILPNSHAEARQLARLFGADPERMHVIPNGVDKRFAQRDPSIFRALEGEVEFVLYVGRIEPRKNVLGLVRACQVARLPLVVIGDPVPGYERYALACRTAGQGSVRWLGGRAHDDPFLASAYAAARVFALPSWFETPGLAALEAALAGCAVVLTPFGCTGEYFGNRVEYARPDRPDALVQALQTAWARGADPALGVHVERHFLWSTVARKTAEVYDALAR
jgi:glycosyltransferase involved in cell wall biosynthesis